MPGLAHFLIQTLCKWATASLFILNPFKHRQLKDHKSKTTLLKSKGSFDGQEMFYKDNKAAYVWMAVGRGRCSTRRWH